MYYTLMYNLYKRMRNCGSEESICNFNDEFRVVTHRFLPRKTMSYTS